MAWSVCLRASPIDCPPAPTSSPRFTTAAPRTGRRARHARSVLRRHRPDAAPGSGSRARGEGRSGRPSTPPGETRTLRAETRLAADTYTLALRPEFTAGPDVDRGVGEEAGRRHGDPAVRQGSADRLADTVHLQGSGVPSRWHTAVGDRGVRERLRTAAGWIPAHGQSSCPPPSLIRCRPGTEVGKCAPR